MDARELSEAQGHRCHTAPASLPQMLADNLNNIGGKGKFVHRFFAAISAEKTGGFDPHVSPYNIQ